jgi:subtilisin family serine protease
VAATIASGRGIKGYVPQARIFAYKAVPKGAAGPIGDAIIRAVKRAVKDGCDIISMSFGSSESDVHTALSEALRKAYEKGVFCVAAAGPEAGDVTYPAAFPLVMGVGALGKLGAYPRDSLHMEFESQRRSQDGKYYLANFSNSGRNLDFCAPGVAVVSTVPGGGYIAKDGTSMACPQVVGIAALALAAHPEVMNAKRDGTRVDDLVHILKSRSEPLGFGPRYEGIGSLKVTSLLGA